MNLLLLLCTSILLLISKAELLKKIFEPENAVIKKLSNDLDFFDKFASLIKVDVLLAFYSMFLALYYSYAAVVIKNDLFIIISLCMVGQSGV